jgi:hypothetical protein
MENIQKQIEDFKQTHPEIAEAMEIFKIGMEEYQQAFKFLNEPQTYTSNTSNPDYIHSK